MAGSKNIPNLLLTHPDIMSPLVCLFDTAGSLVEGNKEPEDEETVKAGEEGVNTLRKEEMKVKSRETSEKSSGQRSRRRSHSPSSLSRGKYCSF